MHPTKAKLIYKVVYFFGRAAYDQVDERTQSADFFQIVLK
jgi:hypothetical protein